MLEWGDGSGGGGGGSVVGVNCGCRRGGVAGGSGGGGYGGSGGEDGVCGEKAQFQHINFTCWLRRNGPPTWLLLGKNFHYLLQIEINK